VQQEREVFRQQIEQVDPTRLFFFDETGFNLGMTRLYGRAPSSERAYGKVPVNTGTAITLVLGLGLQGIVAPFAFEGAMNGHVFGGYMSEQVVPQLPPDAIVVVDNLSAHHADEACDTLEEHGIAVVDDLRTYHPSDAPEERGIEVWFLPPYSPEMSPVEECNSKIKALTRAEDPRTASAVIDAMGHAIGKVTPQDARGWFDHARRDRAPRPCPKVTDLGGAGGGCAPTNDQPRAGPSG
jgi:transposase